MAWIESHQELGTHPKLHKLARVLHMGKPCAIGHLHYLWWWAVDYAPDGDLSRFEPLDIAIGGEWEGEPQVFIDALVRCGFLDETGDSGLFIHDWDSYAGKLIDRRERNAERMREARAERKETSAEHVQRTHDARVKLPNLTIPNQTEHINAHAASNGSGPRTERPPEDFMVVWSEYPNKANRSRAIQAWKKLRPDAELREEMLRAIRGQKQTRQWRDGIVPHFTTWLNGERWTDGGIEVPPDPMRGITA